MTMLQEPLPFEAPTEPIRIFLVDDHPIVREGVRSLLSAAPHIEIVGEAASAAEAIARIGATSPHIAILDVQLPDGDGVELCNEIKSRHPTVACLMLTSFADDDVLFDAIRAGAAGFLLKNVRADGLTEAIERVHRGESFVDGSLTQRLLARVRQSQPEEDPQLSTLTPLERAILRHLAQGLTNKEIAPLVHVSPATVKNYVSSILRKLNLTRRTEAAVFALRAGEL